MFLPKLRAMHSRTPPTLNLFDVVIQDVQAAAAASRRMWNRGAQERDAELARQAAVLDDVPEGDVFSIWAKKEDGLTRDQWQPLR